jgi:hypothetical protein
MGAATAKQFEEFEQALHAYKGRGAKRIQSQYSWYDDDGIRQGGLIAFVRYFWHLLEPEKGLVDCWPLPTSTGCTSSRPINFVSRPPP